MTYRLLTLIGVMALCTAGAVAQDYDDIYSDGTTTTVKSERPRSTTVLTQPRTVSEPTRYKVTVEKMGSARDEDEYNRRGSYRPLGYTDTVATDSSYLYDDNTFANTERLQRFYDPNIVDGSGDDELITLYYDTTPTVNLVIGSNWGWGPYWGWGWSGWYDPWYASWYGPGWGGGWYRGWYGPGWGWYSSWYDPWYWDYGWGWGWNRP